MLRYPLPPHLVLPQPVPRQPLHGSYNFPVSFSFNKYTNALLQFIIYIMQINYFHVEIYFVNNYL